MSDKAARGKSNSRVHYHQFDISDENGPTGPASSAGTTDRSGSAGGVTIVVTGLHTGDVDVTVTRRPSGRPRRTQRTCGSRWTTSAVLRRRPSGTAQSDSGVQCTLFAPPFWPEIRPQ